MEYIAGVFLLVVFGLPVLWVALAAFCIVASLVCGFGPPWEEEWDD